MNEHHPVPKSRGGRVKHRIHVVCHSKIHSLFSEKELEREYSDFASLREHPEIVKFVRWVRKKPPGYRARNRTARSRRDRRRRR